MRQQYNHPVAVGQVQRDEDWIVHSWYRFLLWVLGIGGAAILIWLLYGGFVLGRWTAPTTPAGAATVTHKVSVEIPGLERVTAATERLAAIQASKQPVPRTARPSPAPTRAAIPKPTAQPPAPQQVQISGSLDLVHHKGQETQTAPTAAEPRRLSPQERDEAWARYLERKDP